MTFSSSDAADIDALLSMPFAQFSLGSVESYGLTIERAFEGSLAIRIRCGINRTEIAYRSASDVITAYQYGQSTLGIDSKKWISFLYNGAIAEFWTVQEPKRQLGLDGEDWQIDGYSMGKLRSMSQWCPSDNDVVFRMGSALMGLVPRSALSSYDG